MTLQLAVRHVLADLGFERKFNPNQPRDPDGKWGDGTAVAAMKPVDRKLDKLKLDGRINLGPGERLVASGKAKQDDQSDVAMPIAVINTPTGPQVRLGVDDGDDEGGTFDDDDDANEDAAGGWSGNSPLTTVRLDQAGFDQLRDAITRENAAGKERQAQIRADWERMDELKGASSPADQAELANLNAKYAGNIDDRISQGVIPGLPGGGSLAYEVHGDDDGDGGWRFAFAVKPANAGDDWDFDGATDGGYLAGRMDPKQATAYQRQIASMIAKAGDARSALQLAVRGVLADRRHLPGKHEQKKHGNWSGKATKTAKAVAAAAKTDADTGGQKPAAKPAKVAASTKPATKAPVAKPRPEPKPAVSRTPEETLAAAPKALDAEKARALPKSQVAALERYRGSDFAEINAALRGSGKKTASIDKTVAEMDAAHADSKLAEPIVVHRGIGNVEKVFGSAAAKNLVGAEWTDAAPQSTTADPDIADRFQRSEGEGRRTDARLVVRVPAGIGAIQLSDGRYEAEMLLERGLRMRVISDSGPWRRGQKKPRTIEVEVVPA